MDHINMASGATGVQIPLPPRAPLRAPPAGACDSHTHVCDLSGRFPLRWSKGYPPPDAPFSTYRAMLDATGLDRGVVVQITIYGDDNAAMIDALAQGSGALAGVAMVSPDVADDHLATLASAGVRGLRFITVESADGKPRFPGAAGFDALDALAPRMREHGLFAELWSDMPQLTARAAYIRDLPVPVILEHMGGAVAPCGPNDARFQTFLSLLGDTDAWVKLAICRVSSDYPDFRDVRPLHDALISARSDQLLWASDWPHVRMGGNEPDVGHLLDLFDSWIDGDELIRHRILVDNPARAFSFAT
jgi:predicted TIM-barrel fold metal-dependent hydrolase